MSGRLFPLGSRIEEMETSERERERKLRKRRHTCGEKRREADAFRGVLPLSYLSLSFVFSSCQRVAHSYILP